MGATGRGNGQGATDGAEQWTSGHGSPDDEATPVRDGSSDGVERYDGEAQAVMASVARTFDLATRLLPLEVRTDVRRLYLVLRTLDDLVDHGAPEAPERIAAVEAWARGEPSGGREPEILDDLAGRHPSLPLDAIEDFCAGMRADLAGPRHVTDADLDRYCYQVAGTVGRLMAVLLGIEEGREAEADVAARALGAAMQRTNIIRDLREDARNRRVYLPDTTLAAAGVAAGDAAAALVEVPAWPLDRRRALLAGEIARADDDYAAGLAGVGCLLRGRRGIRAAGAMYRGILREVERDGYGASGRRAVVPRIRKLRLVGGAIAAGPS